MVIITKTRDEELLDKPNLKKYVKQLKKEILTKDDILEQMSLVINIPHPDWTADNYRKAIDDILEAHKADQVNRRRGR